MELKHTIKLIQELTSEIDEIEAAIKQIMDEEIKSPILTIPGISYRMGAMIIAESVTSIVLIQQIKYWPMLGCLHPHTNPVNWITVIPVWRNVVPDISAMPFTMRQNMSAIGINLSVHILKKAFRRKTLQCSFISCCQKTCQNYLCNGKVRTVIHSICLTLSIIISFLEHL